MVGRVCVDLWILLVAHAFLLTAPPDKYFPWFPLCHLPSRVRVCLLMLLQEVISASQALDGRHRTDYDADELGEFRSRDLYGGLLCDNIVGAWWAGGGNSCSDSLVPFLSSAPACCQWIRVNPPYKLQFATPHRVNARPHPPSPTYTTFTPLSVPVCPLPSSTV